MKTNKNPVQNMGKLFIARYHPTLLLIIMLLFSHLHYSKRRILSSLILVVAVISIAYWLDHHVDLIEAKLQSLGHWAGIGFIALFVLLTPLFFSVDVLCVIAGALFSLSDAIIYVLIATMLAAAVIFQLGRTFAREKAQHLLDQHPKLAVYVSLIDESGFKIMLLLRLLPFPFALLSYLFSLSRTSFLPYWLATIGIFFYNTALVYFGFLAAHISDQLTEGQGYEGPHNALLFVGIFACAVIIVVISKIAKHEIAQMHPDQSL